jgi:hypothetical protein
VVSGHWYILKDREPVAVESLEQWARWRAAEIDNHVADDTFGEVRVSTIFLGLDHSFGDGPPLLFETMIFGGKHDQEQWRCSTWDEAQKQHADAVRLAQGKTK